MSPRMKGINGSCRMREAPALEHAPQQRSGRAKGKTGGSQIVEDAAGATLGGEKKEKQREKKRTSTMRFRHYAVSMSSTVKGKRSESCW